MAQETISSWEERFPPVRCYVTRGTRARISETTS